MAWITVFATLTALIQLNIPYPFDDDTAYHFCVARLMRQHGLLYSFPWTPFSWQANHYADKELLFHLLFVPFTGLDFVTASRIVGTITGTGLLTALYLVMRSERVRLPGVWALMPIASSVFLFRFALVRPHLLSITLAIVMAWALANNRLRPLACCSLLFPLAYVAFWQIPLILILAAESSRLLSGGRILWRPALTVASGAITGVLLHPNSWNLLQLNWIHMTDILVVGAWGKHAAVELGSEFFPYSPAEWLRFLLLTALFAVTSLYYAWKERYQSCIPLAYASATLLFALLTMKSMRFLEYLVPFSVVALAVATRSLRSRILAPSLLACIVLYTLAFGTGPARALFSDQPRLDYVAPDTARFFLERIPEGSQVFTCSWDYTGGLMLALPDRKFIVAADPTLFYLNDPARYALWSRIAQLDPSVMTGTIRETFKSRFVMCENSLTYEHLFNTLSSDPTVTTLLVNSQWVLFDLGGPAFK